MRSLKGSLVALVICLAGVAAMSRAASHEQLSRRTTPPQTPLMTAVEGPSNFHRLGIAFESSDMGRTGVWGPSPESYEGPSEDFTNSETLSQPVVLGGADIYRLSCRPCHKADGNGAPPEIPAITGPVQATSAALMERRMQERGRPITAAFARELASGSQKDLLARLKNGGQKMPAFGYLTESETHALIGYLDMLAGVSGNGKTATVTEPAARVGELLVKGTCHICHDATGTWPDPQELLEGSIPPIAGFTTKKTLPEFIWKVRHGAPVVMGSLQLKYRGRMPVFGYLSDDDVAAAYLYLRIYGLQNPGRIREPQD
jgi:mono/diheme cytochrome c family protein